MLVSILSAGLLTIWLAVIGVGLVSLRRSLQRWGLVGIVLGLLALVVHVALALMPVGIGEPLIRIAPLALWSGVAIAVLLALASTWLYARRGVATLRPHLRWSALALLPVIAAGSLWGLSRISTPERERERDATRRRIFVPTGFVSEIVADARGVLDNPTVIAFDELGRLTLADIDGNVWIGQDLDNDGIIDRWQKFADGFQLLVGLLWRGDEAFVSSAGKIEALRDTDGDGRADARRTLAEGLPSLILQPHSNNSLTWGPDGRIYVGVGSTVASGREPNPRAGAILSVSPDGGDVRVFARGFGNPFETAFNSKGALFSGDNANGPDARDELNHVVEGGEYNATHSDGEGFAGLVPGEAGAPIASFPAHSTPTGMTIYTGSAFPPAFRDSAFIALWQRGEVVFAELSQHRQTYAARPVVFGSGFLYPIDVVMGPDEALYVADFGTSVVYRIRYVGP
jgi:putative membrane-bound dehydrogenase-like protein